MSRHTKQIRYFDAGSTNGGTQLQEASEAYFAEGLMADQGHVILCGPDEVVAVTGTRWMTKPIGYLRDGTAVVIVNGDGVEIQRYEDVSWVTGTQAAS